MQNRAVVAYAVTSGGIIRGLRRPPGLMAQGMTYHESLSDDGIRHITEEIERIVAFIDGTRPDAREPSILERLLRFLVERTLKKDVPTRKEISKELRISEIGVSQAAGELRNKLRSYNDRPNVQVRFSIPKDQYEVEFGSEQPGVSNYRRFLEKLILESLNQQVGMQELETWLARAKRHELNEEGTKAFLREIETEFVSRQLTIVLDWLARAKRDQLAEPGTQLFLTEACLARIMGRGLAGDTLEKISTSNSNYGHTALLELLTYRFANRSSLWAAPIHSRITDAAINSRSEPLLRGSIAAMLALGYLRGDQAMNCDKPDEEKARECLKPYAIVQALKDQASVKFNDGRSSGKTQPLHFYCAIPMALGHLALGDGRTAEEYLDIIYKQRPSRHDGYPFTWLTYDLDRAFVLTCINEEINFSRDRLRQVKGHTKLILEYIRFLRRSGSAKTTFLTKTRVAKWGKAKDSKEQLDKRLDAFAAKLSACVDGSLHAG